MPELGPDICYSRQEFLSLAGAGDLNLEDFSKERERILALEAKSIIEACQECNWIAFDRDGRIVLTAIGQQIAECMKARQAARALQIQIASMIRTYDWPWASSLRHGREEALRRMPEDARQCFSESLALERNWPKQLIQWWDQLSKSQREVRADENLEVGRHAEELSFEYERRRTSVRPEWVALESSFNGYDILSRKSKSDDTPFRIEVKATSAKLSDAEFWVTRHEWRTARTSGDYSFHLWSLGSTNRVSIVDFEEVEKHTPVDRNKGRWENVKIKFGPFFSGAHTIVEFKSPSRMKTPIPRRILPKRSK